MIPEGEIWGLKLSRLSWNTAEVKAMTRREDLWANPTINRVSTESFSIKQQLQSCTGPSAETPRSSGNTLINIQITVAQLKQLKPILSLFPVLALPHTLHQAVFCVQSNTISAMCCSWNEHYCQDAISSITAFYKFIFRERFAPFQEIADSMCVTLIGQSWTVSCCVITFCLAIRLEHRFLGSFFSLLFPKIGSDVIIFARKCLLMLYS